MTSGAADSAISVVIPTHNPREDYLARVIEALRVQTLPRERWELLLIDNASGEKVEGRVDIGWHPHARVVREDELGLTFARLRGFAEAKGELVVMVDDDNLLAPDYLETALRIAQERPGLGAFGGKCLPEFETKPDPWLEARGKGLGLRDRGDREELFPREHTATAAERRWVAQQPNSRRYEEGESANPLNDRAESARQREAQPRATTAKRQRRMVREFPDCAPIGAGMVIRREAAAAYAERIAQRACGIRHTAYGRTAEDENSLKHCPTESPSHRAAAVITDRRGDSLASGGDNDICLTVVEEGWQVGYLPELKLTHLIPKERMTLDYHKRMARDSMKSFILMLDQHGIRPWPAMPKWTWPLRVACDWWRVKPWRGPDESLRFWGNTGMYRGRAALWS